MPTQLTVAKHSAHHKLTSSPEFTVHVMAYIKTHKCISRPNTITNNRKIAWIYRLNTLIPNGMNIFKVLNCGETKEFNN